MPPFLEAFVPNLMYEIFETLQIIPEVSASETPMLKSLSAFLQNGK